MKYTFTLILFFLYIDGFTQISESDLARIQNEIERETKDLKAKLTSTSSNDLIKEFKIDTFKIEILLQKRQAIDYSTSGMINSTSDALAAYDVLLNKYYKKLLAMLEEKDKAVLQEAQRNWIKFRDAEIQLTDAVADKRYSGGGTIQAIISTSYYLELTKYRVIELFHHLTRN